MKRIISRQFLAKARRPSRKGTRRGPNFKAKTMTQPERDFFIRVLSPMALAGQINHLRFQALTFESGQGSKYTPDFTARDPTTNIGFAYEVKGPYVYEDSVIKFKGCVLLYPDWVWFWCQQGDAGAWTTTRASPTQEPGQIPDAARGQRRSPPDPHEGEGVRGET
jgi:hypothetical protein